MTKNSIKSVSELHKPKDHKVASQNAQNFAYNKIKEIFRDYIVRDITDDIKVKLIQSGQLFYNNNNSKTLSYYTDIENIVITMDILLQGRNIRDMHDLINYCIQFIPDEYYIENKKIYPSRNQKIIRAIKTIDNSDLDIILQDVSVSMDYKTALWRLRKFFEKDGRQKMLKEKLDSELKFNKGKNITEGEKCVDIRNIHKMAVSFFNFINSFEKDVTHSPSISGKEATQLELEIFFDFGLSLARIVL